MGYTITMDVLQTETFTQWLSALNRMLKKWRFRDFGVAKTLPATFS
jgi:hypothetical protein